MKQYDSFESALRDSDSYEDPRLIEVVARKTSHYRETLAARVSRKITSRQTAQNVFVLSYVEPDRQLEILEVGGACGAGYFEMKHLVPERIARWSICETPAMAAAARRVSSEHGLSFHSDLESGTAALGRRGPRNCSGSATVCERPFAVVERSFSTWLFLRLCYEDRRSGGC